MGMMRMEMALLPQWLRWVWAVALVLVLVLHLRHASQMQLDARRWHIGHSLMAAGMIAMYLLPQASHPDVYHGGMVVFGLLAVAAGAAVTVSFSQTRRLNWLWLASTIDLAIMTYMAAPARHWPAPLTYLAVAYLVIETLAWLFVRTPSLDADALPITTATIHSSGNSPGGTSTITRPTARVWHSRPASDVTLGVRITLAVMALAMAWMLVAMQNMHTSGGMTPGMHG